MDFDLIKKIDKHQPVFNNGKFRRNTRCIKRLLKKKAVIRIIISKKDFKRLFKGMQDLAE